MIGSNKWAWRSGNYTSQKKMVFCSSDHTHLYSWLFAQETCLNFWSCSRDIWDVRDWTQVRWWKSNSLPNVLSPWFSENIFKGQWNEIRGCKITYQENEVVLKAEIWLQTDSNIREVESMKETITNSGKGLWKMYPLNVKSMHGSNWHHSCKQCQSVLRGPRPP